MAREVISPFADKFSLSLLEQGVKPKNQRILPINFTAQSDL